MVLRVDAVPALEKQASGGRVPMACEVVSGDGPLAICRVGHPISAHVSTSKATDMPRHGPCSASCRGEMGETSRDTTSQRLREEHAACLPAPREAPPAQLNKPVAVTPATRWSYRRFLS